jgi:hypothetical protein
VRRTGLIVLLAALALPGRAQEPPPIRSFDVPTLEALGRAIYEQDILAAAATDTLFAAGSQLDKDGIRGWIVQPRGTGYSVRFVRISRTQPDAFEVAYDITSAVSVPSNRTLAADELAQFKARRLAAENVERPCSNRYNTVALREPGSDRWLVWALAATTQPGALVIGGHYRFTISADGAAIANRDALSRSCFTVPPPPPDAVSAYMTHLVSDTPVETHVYMNLLHKTPLYISVPDRSVWIVDQGRMTKARK